MDLSSQIWQIALALILIIGLVFALGVIAKRVQGMRGLQSGSLTILESTAIGPKEKLLLVQIEGKRVLLGVNQQCIAKLLELESKQPDFADVLSECTTQEQVA